MVEVSGVGQVPERPTRYYHKEDLVKAVNRMLERYDFYPVSDRTIKSDLKFMQSGEGFGAVLAKR